LCTPAAPPGAKGCAGVEAVCAPSAKAATVDAKNAVAATIDTNFRMTTFSLYFLRLFYLAKS
jgi:hypothetical protein